ncbi:hypothetical protein FisN_27Hu111 [Fistulifera solaris]|uniref:Uncharacterized protein n=1 Tax=Fistulifera solaris TaxID=1519565 RepID=A0A1Z5KPN5_FISSO|nr:hypothetical protein FisN_27Hu111 [Fistulifera solaris]|eukprot:GAX28239.1 hypothetical protein FisN_27Hu111 [Fistulifera solaris]
METAIIVAVDTANLLERSKYATICRVMTDNVDTTMEFRIDTGAPIRRSRICITIRRTEDYTNWLKDNI